MSKNTFNFSYKEIIKLIYKVINNAPLKDVKFVENDNNEEVGCSIKRNADLVLENNLYIDIVYRYKYVNIYFKEGIYVACRYSLSEEDFYDIMKNITLKFKGPIKIEDDNILFNKLKSWINEES